MSTLREAAVTTTSLACRVASWQQAVRATRSVLRRACWE